MPAFSHPLGLSKTEWRVIATALRAHQLVSNGYYLTSPREKPAAFRLIERGFLTRAKHASFAPPIADDDKDWGIVIVITKTNIANYNAALKREQRSARRKDRA